jgi:hypothetical protein
VVEVSSALSAAAELADEDADDMRRVIEAGRESVRTEPLLDDDDVFAMARDPCGSRRVRGARVLVDPPAPGRLAPLPVAASGCARDGVASGPR